MARRHGWQLPFHQLQVVAITVFLVLLALFYCFLSPFLGKDSYQHIATGVYSFLALSVLVLYARCTAIDPADPGILINVNEEDYGEEALFCTLCNREVRKNSKHCRSCDKCVDGFDHHSRWLNNCVGRKNYATYLCLVAAGLFWLAVECGVGIAVFVRCFTDKASIEDEINELLGYSMSGAPFRVIVAMTTSISLLAFLPLAEWFVSFYYSRLQHQLRGPRGNPSPTRTTSARSS